MAAPTGLDAYLVTFNCGRTLINSTALASHFFDGLSDLSSQDQLPALIVIHLQEISPIADAFCGPRPLRSYFNRFCATVEFASRQKFPNGVASSGRQNDSSNVYADPITHHAGLTAIMLFVRLDLKDHIASVSMSDVGVGVQQMGNKGAAALRVSWTLNKSPGIPETMNLTFVSAHLAPMEEALDRRNQDFLDIAAGLVFDSSQSIESSAKRVDTGHTDGEEGEEDEPLLSSDDGSNDNNMIGMYAPDTHLFFAGDLNYRTSSTRPAHDNSDQKYFPQPKSPSSSPSYYLKLLERDQLTAQRHAGKTLHGLTEAPITFPPTYKYSSDACFGQDVMLDDEVTEWKWSTHRWPSWCDRILYSNSPSSSSSSSLSSIKIHKYTCLPLLATSDHRPVTLSVTIPQSPALNHELASSRPVPLNPHWKSHRQTAELKEQAIGQFMRIFGSREGLADLGSGVLSAATVAAIIEISTTDPAAIGVYAPVILVGLAGIAWAYTRSSSDGGDDDDENSSTTTSGISRRSIKRALWPIGGAVLGGLVAALWPNSGGSVVLERESVVVETTRGGPSELR